MVPPNCGQVSIPQAVCCPSLRQALPTPICLPHAQPCASFQASSLVPTPPQFEQTWWPCEPICPHCPRPLPLLLVNQTLLQVALTFPLLPGHLEEETPTALPPWGVIYPYLPIAPFPLCPTPPGEQAVAKPWEPPAGGGLDLGSQFPIYPTLAVQARNLCGNSAQLPIY